MGQNDMNSNRIGNNNKELKFSAKHLDWMLQKLAEVKIGMAEIGIASEIWNKLTQAHKERINEQRNID